MKAADPLGSAAFNTLIQLCWPVSYRSIAHRERHAVSCRHAGIGEPFIPVEEHAIKVVFVRYIFTIERNTPVAFRTRYARSQVQRSVGWQVELGRRNSLCLEGEVGQAVI